MILRARQARGKSRSDVSRDFLGMAGFDDTRLDAGLACVVSRRLRRSIVLMSCGRSVRMSLGTEVMSKDLRIVGMHAVE
jgi:hypothetical protein